MYSDGYFPCRCQLSYTSLFCLNVPQNVHIIHSMFVQLTPFLSAPSLINNAHWQLSNSLCSYTETNPYSSQLSPLISLYLIQQTVPFHLAFQRLYFSTPNPQVKVEANTLESDNYHVWMKYTPSNPLGSIEGWHEHVCECSMDSESHKQMALYSVKWANVFLRRQQTDKKYRKQFSWKRNVTDFQRKISIWLFSSCSKRLFELSECIRQEGLTLPYSTLVISVQLHTFSRRNIQLLQSAMCSEYPAWFSLVSHTIYKHFYSSSKKAVISWCCGAASTGLGLQVQLFI